MDETIVSAPAGIVYMAGGQARDESAAHHNLARRWTAALLAREFLGWHLQDVGGDDDALDPIQTAPSLWLVLDSAEPLPGVDEFGEQCGARLGIVLPTRSSSDVTEYAGSAGGYDSLYFWPLGETKAETAEAQKFAQWLRLGVALAQLKFEAQAGRRLLTDALLTLRHDLASQLHNGPIQELVAGTFLVGLIPDGLGEPVLAQVQTALAQLRELCQRLQPPVLRDMGIGAAVRATLRIYQRSHPDWSPQVVIAPELPHLESRTSEVLYSVFDLFLACLLQQAQQNPDSVIGVDLESASGETEQGRADPDSAGVRLELKYAQAEPAPDLEQKLNALLPLAEQLVATVAGHLVYRARFDDSSLDNLSSRGKGNLAEKGSEQLYVVISIWAPADLRPRGADAPSSIDR